MSRNVFCFRVFCDCRETKLWIVIQVQRSRRMTVWAQLLSRTRPRLALLLGVVFTCLSFPGSSFCVLQILSCVTSVVYWPGGRHVRILAGIRNLFSDGGEAVLPTSETRESRNRCKKRRCKQPNSDSGSAPAPFFGTTGWLRLQHFWD